MPASIAASMTSGRLTWMATRPPRAWIRRGGRGERLRPVVGGHAAIGPREVADDLHPGAAGPELGLGDVRERLVRRREGETRDVRPGRAQEAAGRLDPRHPIRRPQTRGPAIRAAGLADQRHAGGELRRPAGPDALVGAGVARRRTVQPEMRVRVHQARQQEGIA